MTSIATISSLKLKEYDLVKNLIDPLNPLSKQLYIYSEDIWGNSFIISDLSSYLESKNKDDKLKIVEVHCDEVASYENDIKPLYDEILYKLEYQEKDNKNVSCRDSSDFFRKLNEITTAKNWSAVYIFLNYFDKLRKFDATNLNILVNMGRFLEQSSSGVNIITILFSRMSPRKMFSEYSSLDLFSVYLPKPKESEIVDFLLKEYNGESKSFNHYSFYVQQMVKTHFAVSTNISELISTIKTSWSTFRNCLEEGKHYSEMDLINKWKQLLIDSVSSCYTRFSINQIGCGKTNELYSCCLQLPYCSKYLLIAGFLASYNNKADDKNHFVKKTEKTKLSSRQKHSARNKEQIDKSLLSPKAFSIDRLFAIYSYIVPNESIIDSYWSVWRLVDSLVEYGFFKSVHSKKEILKSRKYICAASFDFMLKLAHDLRFDVKNYLSVSGRSA